MGGGSAIGAFQKSARYDNDRSPHFNAGQTQPVLNIHQRQNYVASQFFADTALAEEAQCSSEQHTSRITKRDQILTLPSRSEEAIVRYSMEPTGWQQQGIRGILAASVKKKLGLKLTSSKSVGELRRARIRSRGSDSRALHRFDPCHAMKHSLVCGVEPTPHEWKEASNDFYY